MSLEGHADMPPAHEKINVLFIIVQMEMGGAERLVHTLASKLDRTRFAPSVAWFKGDAPLKEFSDLGIPLYHVPKVKRFDPAAMRQLSGIIKDNNIHIVNAHHFMPMVYAFYGAKLKKQARLFCTMHSEWECVELSWKWKKAGSALLKRSDGVICVTPNVAKAAQGVFNLPQSKTFIIENGVDIAASSSIALRAGARKTLGLKEHEKAIGIAANLKKVKNHIFLLRAFDALIKERTDARLVIMGQGFTGEADNTEDELRAFIKERGIGNKVLMTGYRPDVPALLSGLDVFCLCSRKEGLPISLIEAMAAGLPSLGADVEGIRDVIRHGKDGLLVPLDDVGALKNSLLALIADEAFSRAIGLEGKETVRQRYTLSGCLERYEKLFSERTTRGIIDKTCRTA